MKGKIYIVIGIVSVLIIMLITFLGFKLFEKDYYKIEPGVDKIKKVGKIKNSSYEAYAWLKIQGTDIDYPVLYTKNVEEQFPMKIEKFVWTENKDTKFHNNIRISGHNLYNLSKQPRLNSEHFNRFEELMSFVYYDFAKENKYIQLTIGEEEKVYKIYAAGFLEGFEKYQLSSKDDLNEKMIKGHSNIYIENSIYDYDVKVDGSDKLITLLTCTRMFEDDKKDFYVVGRLLRDGEKINNYKVTKNSNYKEVEKVLKGDDENEDAL